MDKNPGAHIPSSALIENGAAASWAKTESERHALLTGSVFSTPHGGTVCGSAHNPFCPSRTSFSKPSSTISPGAWFLYQQENPSRTSSRLSMCPSGSATSSGSRWYLFNARIHQSPEALNRRKGTGNRRISVGRRLFQRRGDMKDRRQEVTV